MSKIFIKHLAVLFIICSFVIVINISCSPKAKTNYENKLIGIWQAEYEDLIGTHNRYLNFKYDKNGQLMATIDEPDDDSYEIPIQNLVVRDNRIHAELWWGLEKFDGTLEKDHSIIKGNRIIYYENEPKPIVYKRISSDAILAFKIPRIDESGKTQKEYKYEMPRNDLDGIETGNLTDIAHDSSKIDKLMNRILTSSMPNIHGILIMKDGQLVLEEYFYGYDKTRTHRIQSVTKSFTSALIGIALDKGLIKDVNSNVFEYFQDHGNSPWVSNRYNITIKHLLSMTAGLDWRPLTSNSTPDLIEMYKSKNCLEYMLNKKQREQPGAHFFYNDGLSILLGIVLNRASGKAVNDFAEENLFKPLDIRKYNWDLQVDGTTQTGGGLKMRPRDMLKFGLLFLNKGQWKDRQILSEKWIAESTSRQTPIGEEPYGYQWWINKFVINHRVLESYSARGHGEQFIFIVPELNMIAVFTAGNYFQQERRPLEMMAEYILPAFLEKKDILPDQHISAENIMLISGDYANKTNEIFKIKNEGGKLYVIDPAEKRIELLKISDKHYYSINPPGDGIFREDENGKISRLEIYMNGMMADELRRL
jgi:CubicO group peptidase (beta-lactamase class C family)